MPAVFITSTFRAAGAAAALAAVLATPFHAHAQSDPGGEAQPLLAAGIPPGAYPTSTPAPGAEVEAAVARSGRRVETPNARQPGEAKPVEAEAAAPYSPLQYAFFCFGPVFGNSSREIDPNFMPEPTASDPRGRSAPKIMPVRYTRVATNAAGKAVWVGTDGSQITYVARSAGSAYTPPTPEASDSSIEAVISENRKELTKISWARAYRRYPELGRPESAERAAFEDYLVAKHTNPREAAKFENPMWPEAVATEFIEHWNWRRAEAESWERVRAKVRTFNDPESAYTRRFMEFTAGLRTEPEGSALFADPTWPEKALELHDQRLGPVPVQFR